MTATDKILDQALNATLSLRHYLSQRHDERGQVVSSIDGPALLQQMTDLVWEYDQARYISEMPLVVEFRHPSGIRATINLDTGTDRLMPVVLTDGSRSVMREIEHAPTLKPLATPKAPGPITMDGFIAHLERQLADGIHNDTSLLEAATAYRDAGLGLGDVGADMLASLQNLQQAQ